MTAGIYKITNKISGMSYVGQSVNIEQRWAQHGVMLRKRTHHCSGLQEDFNQHGIQGFEFSVVEVLSSDTPLLDREAHWIGQLKPLTYNSEYITPHKGGRTERADVRATPRTRQLLALIKKQTGKTASDVLEDAVQVIAKEPTEAAHDAASK